MPKPTFPNLTVRSPRQFNFKPFLPVPITRLVDGVFEGGATLGSAYVGSLRLMQQSGIWFKRVAGNSAGAITAALIAAGYNAQEIEWLSSNFNNAPPRPGTLHANLTPIDYMTFLDWPNVNTIGQDSMRRTALWKALKGETIDKLLETEVTAIPRQGRVVNDIVAGLKAIPVFGLGVAAVEPAIRGMLNTVLGFLPDRTPRLSDFSLFDNTAALRAQFADQVWKTVALNSPLLTISTQLLHEGSLFEGKVFQQTMDRLLGAKVSNNPSARITMSQLPIPLAVIGCDYATGQMTVFSSRSHPGMLVSDAVRASMSLPLIFEPVGPNKTVIDGGVISNFPAWLFTGSGDAFWPAGSGDASRPIVGLSLDEHKAAPAQWGAAPPKFQVTGGRPQVSLMDVIVPMLIVKLREAGMFIPRANYTEAMLEADLRGWKMLEVLVGWLSVDKEDASRGVILQGLMAGRPYFDVVIPLLGFHGFDFDVNGDREDMRAMAERGFLAARDALSKAPAGGVALVSNPGALGNPYA